MNLAQPSKFPADIPGRSGALARSLPPRPSLPDQIADAIVALAVKGHFALGERLPEIELARQFDVSRIPIREALRLLESRGIAVAIPNRGMRLMTVTEQDLRQMLTVRVSLERLAVREAEVLGKPLPLGDLRKWMGAIVEAANRDDTHGVATADLAFHRSLCVASENAILLQFWDSLSVKMMIIFGAATRTKDLKRLVETHGLLLRHIEDGSTAAIEDAIERHILRDSELEAIIEPVGPIGGTAP